MPSCEAMGGALVLLGRRPSPLLPLRMVLWLEDELQRRGATFGMPFLQRTLYAGSLLDPIGRLMFTGQTET